MPRAIDFGGWGGFPANEPVTQLSANLTPHPGPVAATIQEAQAPKVISFAAAFPMLM